MESKSKVTTNYIINKFLILSKIKYSSQTYNTVKSNLFKILDPIHNEGIRLEPSRQ